MIELIEVSYSPPAMGKFKCLVDDVISPGLNVYFEDVENKWRLCTYYPSPIHPRHISSSTKFRSVLIIFK